MARRADQITGRSNNGLKLDVKTGKLSLWRLFPTFTFTFSAPLDVSRCVDDFDAALNTTCSSAGDTVSCCNSLSALGGQCLSHLAASMAATPDLASLLTAL